MDLQHLNAPSFVCLYQSEFASIMTSPLLNSMMSFPLIQSYFAHLTQLIMFFSCVSYFCVDVSWISSSLPKIKFLLYFQCQTMFPSCYNLDIITLIGRRERKATVIFRGMSVLCFCQVMFYPESCMNIRNNITRIKKYDYYQASVMCIFLPCMAHSISTSLYAKLG